MCLREIWRYFVWILLLVIVILYRVILKCVIFGLKITTFVSMYRLTPISFGPLLNKICMRLNPTNFDTLSNNYHFLLVFIFAVILVLFWCEINIRTFILRMSSDVNIKSRTYGSLIKYNITEKNPHHFSYYALAWLLRFPVYRNDPNVSYLLTCKVSLWAHKTCKDPNKTPAISGHLISAWVLYQVFNLPHTIYLNELNTGLNKLY